MHISRARILVGRVALPILLAAAAVLAVSASAAGAKVVWLCRPGQHPDPCTPGLSTTVYSPTLHELRVTHPKPVANPKIDCFYVYPTVSNQKTEFANLRVDPEERSMALMQVARYSQYCRVFAPMYRQHTIAALTQAVAEHKPLPSITLGLGDVRRAFHTYLARYNHGRGFVLIGHSQGARVLKALIASDVDRRPSVRRRLVSAILLGGNLLVKRGRAIGGDFKHVPACRSATQLGCVIAFSTFDQVPPPNSMFGRSPRSSEQVVCTNPASLSGDAGKLDPIFPTAPFAPGTAIAAALDLLGLTQPMPDTVWSSEPGAYRARCSSRDGATVLETSPVAGAQVAKPSPDPTWGLHLLDANVALGNLLTIVSDEAAAFAKRTQ